MRECMFYISFKDTIRRTVPLCFNNKNVLKLIIIMEVNMIMQKLKQWYFLKSYPFVVLFKNTKWEAHL